MKSHTFPLDIDEHVWLSVKNAEVLSKAIADALEKADPDHKNIYQENASAYSEKLKDPDAKYQEVVDWRVTKNTAVWRSFSIPLSGR